ncbi:MAG: DUF3604 domain-containing protein [Deltaproteobacteria bacterium]|nr:DUF3604 domain-containing protein [Deltaproteobacteria bacterium]
MKKIMLGFVGLLVLGAAVTWFTVGRSFYATSQAVGRDTAPADYALQDDSKVSAPNPEPHVAQSPNPLKNVYWGDTHVHTHESFDATLFGTTLTIEDAYRFAKGDALRSDGGERMQLSRPLDFVAITDHAEGFGTRTRCGNADLSWFESLNCSVMETPNVLVFSFIRSQGARGSQALEPDSDVPAGVYRQRAREHPVRSAWPICSRGEGGAERCERDARTDWDRYIALADAYNEPGVLTTFAAYEYSPTLPDRGKHHRNVIFNGTDLPEHAISSMDVGNAIDLWRGLEQTCTGDCDFLTIPHNMNKGWGLFYSRYTWDGGSYDDEGWQLRKRREPLAEIYQVKGASECALGVGATDEECAFSQILEPCEQGEETGCAFETGFARQGLKVGLELERELGFNPFAFGMIGSTDTHNANPGDAEEWDFVGKVGLISSPAIRRIRDAPGAPSDQKPYQSILQFHTSGGLAAVWAEENTRDAIFDAMKRREVYATSGPRITLRFFAGWGFDESVAQQRDAIAVATEGGVPMGGVLRSAPDEAASPTFYVAALGDSMSAPLQRVQIIKGWIDAEGQTHEKVRDIACADGLEVDPTSLRCPDNGATVDLATCKPTSGSGAMQLMTAWKDPEFDPSEGAFYYVRVLQNPTCRWSTYDALRLGREPDPRVPATLRERGWSSPIWIDAS